MNVCETCGNYCYDEDYECYVCQVNLDEDDMVRFLQGNTQQCAYYRNGDEYSVVRRQM